MKETALKTLDDSPNVYPPGGRDGIRELEEVTVNY